MAKSDARDPESAQVHRSVTISPDGNLVFVPYPGDGTVSIVDHRHRKTVATIATGEGVNNLAAFIPGQAAVHHGH